MLCFKDIFLHTAAHISINKQKKMQIFLISFICISVWVEILIYNGCLILSSCNSLLMPYHVRVPPHTNVML